MHKRSFHTLRNVALAGLAALTVALSVAAFTDTHDVLYMRDGRVLTGQIVRESATEIVFEVIDRRLNLRTTITVRMDTVASIQRGVADEAGETDAGERGAETSAGGISEQEKLEAEADSSLPSLYIVPMKGVMGTDIYYPIYRQIIDNIREEKPDYIVFKLKSSDGWDMSNQRAAQQTQPYFDMEDYIALVNLFKDELSDFKQIMWVEDSVGISSLIALSWSDIYMTSEARLTGLEDIFRVSSGWRDSDVRAKMIAAWTGLAKGFVERGGHSIALAEAMMLPDKLLSCNFRGRTVEWRLDATGEYVLDYSVNRTVNFNAEEARNFRVAKDIADNEADLAFLLGLREFRVIKGKGERLLNDYVTNWRKAMAETEKQWEEYQDHRRWATGDQVLQYLGRARQNLERIVARMGQFKAVEKEWERRGISKLNLELMIEEIRETIRSIRQRARPTSPGGGPGGGGPGLGGGG